MGDYLGGSREKLIHEIGLHHPRRMLQWAAVRWTTAQAGSILREVDAVVAVSAVVAGMAPGVHANDRRLVIIPNGIDPTGFPWLERSNARTALGLPIDATILGFLGRVEEYKGVGRLFDILNQIPEAHLVIAGEGSYADTARRRAAAPTVRGRVHILGSIPDRLRPTVLAASDLLCLPSRMEGQPVTLLEALAMGTPVATTRPWIPESLLPFAVVDPDVFAMVTEGLTRARTFDRKRAREAVLGGFTWDRIARRYLDLFERLRSTRGLPPDPIVPRLG
jgi:glycosyltransferase involved in cell wall biosynthesis